MGYSAIRPNPHRYRARAAQRPPTAHSRDLIGRAPPRGRKPSADRTDRPTRARIRVSAPYRLAPIFVEKVFETIVEINKQGTPILLVEQNALMALEVADRGYVLETGTIALADDAKALRQNEQVRKTYLGEE